MFVLAQPALQTFHCCSNFGKWLPPHAHSWLTLNILKEREFSFWSMLHGPLRWALEDSPFIWQESNLVVWAHLEFVSTDNSDISWPTNNHKRSLYIYWEWTSSHALLGFLLGGRNSRTTYPSVTELFHLFRLNETWRSFFSFNLFITGSSGIFRIKGFFFWEAIHTLRADFWKFCLRKQNTFSLKLARMIVVKFSRNSCSHLFPVVADSPFIRP